MLPGKHSSLQFLDRHYKDLAMHTTPVRLHLLSMYNASYMTSHNSPFDLRTGTLETVGMRVQLLPLRSPPLLLVL